MDNFMLAFILLLVVVLIARVINQRAYKKLEQDKKLELIDLFSKRSIYIFGILIAIIALFFVGTKYNLMQPFVLYSIYATLIFVLILVSAYFSYKKLKKHNFPDDYIRSYLMSMLLRVIGLIAFFALLIDF